MIKQGR